MNIYPKNDKNNCSGCGACVNVCPHNAICMQTDEFGFSYPHIDESKCINCNKCRKACDYAQNVKLHIPIGVYAATNKNRETLLNSSSGGVFSALAEYVISQSGAVCGCPSVRQINLFNSPLFIIISIVKCSLSYTSTTIRFCTHDFRPFHQYITSLQYIFFSGIL